MGVRMYFGFSRRTTRASAGNKASEDPGFVGTSLVRSAD